MITFIYIYDICKDNFVFKKKLIFFQVFEAPVAQNYKIMKFVQKMMGN